MSSSTKHKHCMLIDICDYSRRGWATSDLGLKLQGSSQTFIRKHQYFTRMRLCNNNFHSGVYSVFDVEGRKYIICRSNNLSTLCISLRTHSYINLYNPCFLCQLLLVRSPPFPTFCIIKCSYTYSFSCFCFALNVCVNFAFIKYVVLFSFPIIFNRIKQLNKHVHVHIIWTIISKWMSTYINVPVRVHLGR